MSEDVPTTYEDFRLAGTSINTLNICKIIYSSSRISYQLNLAWVRLARFRVTECDNPIKERHYHTEILPEHHPYGSGKNVERRRAVNIFNFSEECCPTPHRFGSQLSL